MELRDVQKPIKERYREEPDRARVTLSASAGRGETPVACSVGTGAAIREAQAHLGVGGPGTAACSGDLLLEALAACAQITCQMVAAATGIEVEGVEAVAEGEVDLRGTLGVSPEAPVGFESIRLRLEIDAPEATAEELAALRERTERYCTVLQTLRNPPPIDLEPASAPGG